VLVSAAMIVRDEGRNLDACLGSLQPFVDEVVVVDTGSTDDTVDIAKRHGAVLVHQRWRGDFARARNRSLDLASGEWVLYIDADERLRAEGLEAARDALGTAHDQVAFRIRFVPQTGWTPYREYRLWRNHPDIRFQGRIHESIVPSIESVGRRDGLRISDSDLLTIDHLGYDGDQRHKHARNEPILVAALEEHPDRIFYYDHLARIYDALGEGDEAVATWQRGIAVVRARREPHPDDRLLWAHLIMYKLARNQRDGDFDALVDEAIRRFPGLPSLELAAAADEFIKHQPEHAARRLEWVTSLTLDEIIATGCAYDQRVLGEWAWNLLGLCRFELGDDADAAVAFGHAEAAAPGNETYRVRRQLAERRAASESAPSRAPH